MTDRGGGILGGVSAPALDGLRVIEISETAAGAYAGRLLAGMGAEVLMVEPPGGTALRRWGGFRGDVPDREGSAMHVHLNRRKRSVRLELRSAAGRRLLGELLDDVDVLVSDLDRAACGERGIEPAELRATHPSLQVCTITPYGWTGPKADWRATELTSYAAGGYLRIGGEPEREPVKAWGEQAHLQAGVHATLGILAALHARSSGMACDVACDVAGGQHVDVAIHEAVAFLLGGGYQHAWFHDREPMRNGARLVGFGPGHLYPSTIRPCADGWVHAHCNNRYPEQMAVLFDDPRLAAPEMIASLMGRADEVDALMAPLLETLPRREVVRRAQELRLPFTEVLQPSEVLADVDGQHAARDFFQRVPVGDETTVLAPGPAMRFGETTWVDGAAPRLDDAGELLGAPAERVRWRRAGVA